eukprot:845429-Pleurochrysis_carterae.AAC.1
MEGASVISFSPVSSSIKSKVLPYCAALEMELVAELVRSHIAACVLLREARRRHCLVTSGLDRQAADCSLRTLHEAALIFDLSCAEAGPTMSLGTTGTR